MQVGVAVIDTGIYRHRDFGNRIVGFYDVIHGRKVPYDDSGHGTHVSGIIAGNGAASNGKYRGVAPEAAIIGVKALDEDGNGKITDVIDGLSWILKNCQKYNIRVVNISFGTTTDVMEEKDYALLHAVEEVWDAGIVVVAAAGNNGPNVQSVTTPGICRKIITVGAYDDATRNQNIKMGKDNKKLAKKAPFFSGRGPTCQCIMKPEVVVAGSNLVACANKRDVYTMKSGTSMATPVVSGAIARYLENHEAMTPKEIKLRLKKFCHEMNGPKNQQGWGMLNIYQFVTSE